MMRRAHLSQHSTFIAINSYHLKKKHSSDKIVLIWTELKRIGSSNNNKITYFVLLQNLTIIYVCLSYSILSLKPFKCLNVAFE